MAIIYTYPTITPTPADKVLVTVDGTNATANATISSIKETIDVVDTFSSSFGTYISGTNNSSATGNVSIGSIDLSATGTPLSTNFLKGNNTWSSVDLTADVTGILPIANGGTNASTANDALNNLLPDQTSNSGKVLSTDGTNTSWIVDSEYPPGGITGSVQFNGGTAFSGTDEFLYSDRGSENLLEIKGVTDIATQAYKNAKIKLGSTNGALGGNPSAAGGEIELDSGGLNLIPTSVTIAAPRTSISTSYSIKLPIDPPTSNNRILESDSAGDLSWIDTPTGGTPGGADTQMQYNNGGAFGGATGLTWDDSTNILSIGTRFEGDINGALLQQVLVKEPGGVSKGDVVYISGGTGDNPEVKKARANSASTMAALGIM